MIWSKRPAAIFLIGLCLPGTRDIALTTEVICPVIADNSIAAHWRETGDNYGNQPQIKIKGNENQIILKFDLSSIPADSVVTAAVLSLKLAKPDYQLNQIGYSTVPTDWSEGDGRSDCIENSCYKWPGGSGRWWTVEGSMFYEAIDGNAGNVTGWTLAQKRGDRYEIHLSPRVIEAMRRDQPGGLVLTDEFGLWGGSRANIQVCSRESDQPPILRVWHGKKDSIPPSPPDVFQIEEDLERGGLLLGIRCGGNDGDKGIALGFDLRVRKGAIVDDQSWEGASELPRWLIPRPRQSGEVVRIWLSGLEPDARYGVGVVAYDEAGNRSSVGSSPLLRAAPALPIPDLAGTALQVAKGSPLPISPRLQVWAVDELTKVDPLTGAILDGMGYVETNARNGNHVWDGKSHQILLHAARNETVAFRLVLEIRQPGALVEGIRIEPRGLTGPESYKLNRSQFTLRRIWYLQHAGRWYANVVPNLLEKDEGRLDVPAQDQKIPGQILQTILVELHVPRSTPAGEYEGSIAIATDSSVAEVPIRLRVYDATIPDEIGFIIELNSYGQRHKELFHAYHRLAHLYRLGYNCLSYGHTGSRQLPCIPEIAGRGRSAAVKDWRLWDEWMGPVLDGSLFKDLPRGAVPIPHFYLPFYESYPTPIHDEYLNGRLHRNRYLKPNEKWSRSTWGTYVAAHDVYVGDGFSEAWKEAAAAIATEYRRHFEEKGWYRTQFQIFLNNKHFKGRPEEGLNTSLWTLDEPQYGRDFRAIAWLLKTFRTPFEGSALNVVTRADISRPEIQGNRLDNACDLFDVSSAIHRCRRLIQRRMREHGCRYWFYGGGIGPEKALTQLAGLYLLNWTMGSEGGLAYWTSFNHNVWDSADPLACVVNANHGYCSLAIPTDRLAASRRVQQDIELLMLLARKVGSRRQFAAAVAETLNLHPNLFVRHADDPGRPRQLPVTAEKLAALRLAVLTALEEKRTAAPDSLVQL